MKVSIIIPCFNEEATLRTLVDRVLAAPTNGLAREILIVDDQSSDSSRAIAEELQSIHAEVRALALPRHQGKGSAVRQGIRLATGEILLVQDADLEYDPGDYAALLRPFENPAVQVVYGSRILGSSNRSYSRYYWGGRLLTLVANLLFGTRLTDEATGYKAFRREALEGITLTANGFEFCPELTGKFLRKGLHIHEVPIRYQPRSFEEGKKIRWWDGIIAIWTLLKYRLG
ncbi:MAG: glycosyltransferase family 2 protein [Planctomycetota bacterium]